MNFSQYTKSEMQTSAPTYQVELVKLEKTLEGDLTDTLIPGARFYLFSKDGGQLGKLYETDESGKISVELPVGEYYFEEVYPGNNFGFDQENGKPKTKYPFKIKKSDSNEVVTVKAYNVPLVGNLTVEKTVKNADGSPLTKTQKNTTFEFQVTFSDNGAYFCSIDGGEAQKIKSGSYIYLKHGQKAVFSDVPQGVVYSVNETPKEEYTTQSSGHRGTMVAEGRVASFINTHVNVSSGLMITKTVQGTNADMDKEFAFTAIINGEMINFTLKHGESKVFSDLPLGTEYIVTENDYSQHGYVSTISEYSGTIQGEDTVVLPFVNIYQPSGETGQLQVSKRVLGNVSNPEEAFTFQVNFIGNHSLQTPQTFTLKHGEKKVFKNIPAGTQYVVTEIETGNSLPIISEIKGNIAGQSISYADFLNQQVLLEEDGFGSILVRKEVTGTDFDANKEFDFIAILNGKKIPFALRHGETKLFSKVPVGTEFTITEKDYSEENYATAVPVQKGVISGKEQVVVSFTNIFNPSSDPGQIVLEKKVLGDGADPDKIFTFQIEFSGSDVPESPQTFQLKADEQKVFENIPANTIYTITETDSAGYTPIAESIQGKVIGGSSTHLIYPNAVAEEKPPIPNEYATLTIKKDVKGEGADLEKPFEFLITLDGKPSSFTLKHGEQKEFLHLPIGTTYTVTERDYSREGYVSAVRTYTGIITSTEEKILPYTNHYNMSAMPGSLQVSKQVEGENPDLNKEFGFKVEFSGSNAPESPQYFSLKNGETKLFENIPSGVRFVVTEIDSADYLPSTEVINGMIIGEQTTEVSFVNKVVVQPDPPPEPSGSLIVTKQVAGEGADFEKPFEFTAIMNGKTTKFTLKHGETKVFTGLPLGSVYTVTEKDYSDEGYVTPTPSYTGIITTANPLPLEFLNVLNPPNEPGQLVIEKQVVGENQDPNKEFKFEIKFSGQGIPASSETFVLKAGEQKVFDNVLPYTRYKISEIDSAGYIPAKESIEGMMIGGQRIFVPFVNQTPTEVAPIEYGVIMVTKEVRGEQADLNKTFDFVAEIGEQTHEFSLKHGERKEFSDIPLGTSYKIWEKDYSSEGYLTAVSTYSGKVSAKQAILIPFLNIHQSADLPIATGNLVVEKKVLGENPDPNKEFIFEVSFEGDFAPQSPQRFSLKANQKKVFQNIAEGVSYTVSEVDAAGYSPVIREIGGVIVNGQMSTASFVNEVPPINPPNENDKGILEISKDVQGKGADFNKDFIFIVTIGGRSQRISLKHGETKKFTDLPLGTEYAVAELDYSADGYQTLVRNYSGVINSKDKVSLEFINKYNPQESLPNTGDLLVSKEVEGEGDINKDFQFEIIFTGEGALPPKIFTLKAGEKRMFKNLPAGLEYTVKEIDSGGYLPVAKQMSGVIVADELMLAEFVNIVPEAQTPPIYGDILVTEEVRGTNADPKKEFAFTAVIDGKTTRFSLSHGEEKRFENVRIDTAYVVSNDNYSDEGYIAFVTDYDGVINSPAEVHLPFIHVKDAPKDKPGTLRIEKAVIGENPDDTKDFKFDVVFKGKGAPKRERFTLKNGQSKEITNIPAGVQYTVTEIDSAGYSPMQESFTGTIIGGETSVASFKNVVPVVIPPKPPEVGSLVISKQLQGIGADFNKDFEFTVTIDGTPHVFTLKHGQSKEFPNLPLGTEYSVSEKDYSVEGYVSSIKSYTGVIARKGKNEVAFTNYYKEFHKPTYDAGEIVIEKIVEGTGASPDKIFTFRIDFEGPIAVPSETFTLKAGQRKVFSNVPAGTIYKVTEIDSGGYLPITKELTGVVAKDKRVFAKFVNVVPPDIPTQPPIYGSLLVIKEVKGEQADLEKEFKFTATILGQSVEFTLKNGQSKEFLNLPVGTEYTITEEDYTQEGYTTAVKTYTGVITGEQQLLIPFVNVHNPPPDTLGNLTVEKRVTGENADPQKEFTFEIVFEGDTALQNEEFKLKAGQQKVFHNIPHGTKYVVKETDTGGYIPTIPEISGTIIAGENTLVSFVNQVSSENPPPPPIYGSLVVSKEVRGTPVDPNKHFEFTGVIAGQPISFTLANGETKEFPKLPLGTHYTITEKDYSEEGYVTSVRNYTGMITGADQMLVPFINVYNPPQDATGNLIVEKKLAGTNGDPKKQFTFEIVFEGDVLPQQTFKLRGGEQKEFRDIPAGVKYTVRETSALGYTPAMEQISGVVIGAETVTVSFVNELIVTSTPNVGDLIIEKIVTGTGADFNKDFEFTVVIEGQEETFTLKHGQSYVIADLPIGTEYSVVEKDYSEEGYVTATRNFAGVIAKKEDTVVLFENNYNSPNKPEGKVGDLVVEKQVVGENADPQAQFEFEVVFEGDNAPAAERFTLRAGERKVFNFLPAGVKYTVKEINPVGYMPAMEQISGVIIENDTVFLEFVNAVLRTPDPDERASLIISKEVEGKGADLNKEFQFTVTINGNEEVITLKHGQSYIIPDLPIGSNYTVVEEDYSMDGYQAAVTKYKGTVVEAGITELPFKNYFQLPEGPAENAGDVIVAKRVVGETPDPNRVFEFEIEFEGEGAPQKQKFTLKDGDRKSFRNIPAGVKFTVKETNSADYLPIVKEMQGIVTQNQAVFVEFVNAVPGDLQPPENRGSLIVTKEVKGKGADYAKEFEFTITLNGENQTFILKHGESIEFPALPIGTEYIVKEKDYSAEGYTSFVATYTGVIGSQETTVLPFINYYKDSGETVENAGDLIVSKKVLGENPDPDREFTFRITFTGKDAPPSPQVFKLKDGQRKTFKNIPMGVEYIIEEIEFGEYLPTIKELSGVIISGETVFAEFKNAVPPKVPPSPDDRGSLLVKKQVYGKPNNLEKEFEFTATIDGKETKFTLKHGESFEIPDLPIGTEYTIAEKDYTEEYYVTTVKVYKGIITGTEQVVLPFKNYYTPPENLLEHTGSIILEKKVEGPHNNPDQLFTFEIIFEGPGAPANEIVQLKAGDRLIFDNIPEGVKYTVREIDAGGYYPIIEVVQGTIIREEKVLVQFINSSTELAKLKVIKKVDGAYPPEALDREYQFALMANGQRYRFALKPDQEVEFNLPLGTQYEVLEDGISDGSYNQYVENGQGTIVQGITTVVVTNTFLPPKEIVIEGNKSWDLAGYPDTVKPDSILIRLKNGSLLVEEKVVTLDANGNWYYSFTVPRFDALGNEIQYTIEEVPIDGFVPIYDGYNITNKYIPPVEIDPPIIQKVIRGENYPETNFNFLLIGQEGAPMPEGSNGDKKIITLTNAGEVEIGKIAFIKPGVYRYKLVEVNNGQDGWVYDPVEYVLTVTVMQIDGKLTAQKVLTRVDEPNKPVDKAIFNNVYVPGLEDTLIIKGQKHWNHGDNQPQNYPSQIVVTVYANGKLFVQRQVSAVDNWQYSFELPRKDENGNEIVYTIDERPIVDYEKTVDGYDLINTYKKGANSNRPDGGSSSSSGDSSNPDGGGFNPDGSGSDPNGGNGSSSGENGSGSSNNGSTSDGGSNGSGGNGGQGSSSSDKNSKPNKNGNNPTTGDTSTLGLWIVLMISSGIALIALFFIRKRKSDE